MEPETCQPGSTLIPIDLAPYRAGNSGVDYVHRFDSGQPGPVALITALVHGNELCGAYALDFLMRKKIRPVRGSVVLCFANIECYQMFDPAEPYVNRFVDRDMNRVWQTDILKTDRDSYDARRAREILPFVEEADFLLDLHTMRTDCPPIVLTGLTRRSVELATTMEGPKNLVLDAGHAIGTRLRDYGGFADPHGQKTALLVECGQHLDPASAEVAITSCLGFLHALGMLSAEDAARYLKPKDATPFKVEVTEAVQIQTDDFQFVDELKGLEVFPSKGTVIAHDGGEPVRTPYDNAVIIIPSKRLQPGLTAVRFGKII